MKTNTVPVIAASKGKPYRVSRDSVWPLRRADGRTWAESKETHHDRMA